MTIDTLKPAEKNIAVLPDPAPEKTQSGLFIPETNKHVPQTGVVTHIGPNALYKVGDHVLFVKNAGIELPVEPVHFLMWEDDIRATV